MYKYEMHQHTAPCSACGRADPAELIKALKKDGFAGVVLTNHFLHGNTGIDRSIPWQDFVKAYEEDYLKAKQAGDEEDVDVIFGIEEHVGRGKEVLLYGITPQFLYEHPEMADGELETIYNAVHSFGGLVFQAHPFRDRGYIPDPNETIALEFLDGIESYNASNQPEENPLAEAYAVEKNKLQSAGSDAHSEEFENRFGIACNHRIKTSQELADVLRSGDYELIK